MAVSKYKKFKRSKQIVTIFVNHGFGTLIDRLGLTRGKAFNRLSISLVFLSLSIVIAGTIVGLSLTDVEG